MSENFILTAVHECSFPAHFQVKSPQNTRLPGGSMLNGRPTASRKDFTWIMSLEDTRHTFLLNIAIQLQKRNCARIWMKILWTSAHFHALLLKKAINSTSSGSLLSCSGGYSRAIEASLHVLIAGVYNTAIAIWMTRRAPGKT